MIRPQSSSMKRPTSSKTGRPSSSNRSSNSQSSTKYHIERLTHQDLSTSVHDILQKRLNYLDDISDHESSPYAVREQRKRPATSKPKQVQTEGPDRVRGVSFSKEYEMNYFS